MGKRTALITGGVSGIGKATAFHLADKGYQLVINYRNSEVEANSLAKQLDRQFGTKNLAIQGDVANEGDCHRIVKEAVSAYGSIDVFIHNAGPYVHERKKLAEYTFDEWNYILQGNLSSFFYLSKEIIPLMRKQKWGRIITLGFDRAETAPGWIYRSAFASAKTGLASLTRTIALEEREYGITANMVCPGDITNEWKEKNIIEATEAKISAAAFERQGTGEDIARVIGFIVEEKSDFITGSIIPVTGGCDVLGKVFKS